MEDSLIFRRWRGSFINYKKKVFLNNLIDGGISKLITRRRDSLITYLKGILELITRGIP